MPLLVIPYQLVLHAEGKDLKRAAELFDRFPFHMGLMCINDERKLQFLQLHFFRF